MFMRNLYLLLAVMLGGVASASTEENERFSITTLNVDGLPQKILVVKVNADGPGDVGSARIGKYLMKKGNDLLFLQEDFTYHGVMVPFLEDDYKMDEWTGNVGLDGHSIDFLHLQNHRFPCDGLMAFWKNDLVVTPAERTAWKQNFGKFSHAMDEMVTKGFRRYEVTLRNGSCIVVYNMHMDASDDYDVNIGNDTKDKEARMAQWMQLKEAVLAQLDSRPVIVLGDMNSLYKRDDVKRQFIDAIEETGLATVKDVYVELERGGEYPEYEAGEQMTDEDLEPYSGEVLDKILYINPVNGTSIRPVSYSMDKEGYKFDGKPLGDHYPVSAVFEVTSRTVGISAALSVQGDNKEAVYDLSGRKVSKPRGGLYIERRGEKVEKHIVK